MTGIMQALLEGFRKLEARGTTVRAIRVQPRHVELLRASGDRYVDFSVNSDDVAAGFIGTLWGARVELFGDGQAPNGGVIEMVGKQDRAGHTATAQFVH